MFNWSYNGKALGNAPANDNMRNGRLAINYFNGGHNVWRKFKIIFRPDPSLIKANPKD